MKTKSGTTRHAPDAHAVEEARQMLTDAIMTEDGAIAVAGAFMGLLDDSFDRLGAFLRETSKCKDYRQFKKRAVIARGMVRNIESGMELSLSACLNLLNADCGE